MVELPMVEKVTLKDRRGTVPFSGEWFKSLQTDMYTAAQKTQTVQNSSKSYITTTILPEQYRAVLAPGKIPTTELESAYVGLYTMIISLIYLNSGTILETKLARYLERLNADIETPIDKTDKLLQKLVAQKYLVRIKDNTGGEETVEYKVGPRGRTEVGFDGVWGLCQELYKPKEEEMDELERRVRRSMGLQTKTKVTESRNRDSNQEVAEDEAPQPNGTQRNARQGAASQAVKTGKRRSTRAQNEEEEEEEEEEAEEDVEEEDDSDE
jgi:melanoma-associated antigen